MAESASLSQPGTLGGQHAGGHSDVFSDFQKSSAQTLSTPMGGAHGKIDYSVDMSQAQKVTPQWTAQQTANRNARLASQASEIAKMQASRKSAK